MDALVMILFLVPLAVAVEPEPVFRDWILARLRDACRMQPA